MVALGFASGLPSPLIRDVLTIRMSQVGTTTARLGTLAMLTWPAALKFVWAPLLDRYSVPLLGGRRRGWALVFQVVLVGSILALGRTGGRWAAVVAVGWVVAVASASFDVVADAYRTDLLPPRLRAAGTSYWVTAWRLAVLAVGFGLLRLVGRGWISWPTGFALAAGVMGLTMLGTAVAPTEPVSAHRPRSLADAVVKPVVDLWARPRGLVLLIFVFGFKIPEIMASRSGVIFLTQSGYRPDQIGQAKLAFGLVATILGTLTGGVILRYIPVKPGLVVLGFAGAVSNLGFLVLARNRSTPGLMPTIVCIESFCGGLAVAAFVAFLMGQCDRRFTATHFAVLSGLSTLSDGTLGLWAGQFATAVGWPTFFAVTAAAGVPALILIPWLPAPTAD